MNTHYVAPYLLNPTHRITVNLIGAGGTGSQVLQALSKIDYALWKLGHPGLFVTVYDNDIVTEANIGRQLFCQSDIGLNKANVLVSRANAFMGTDWDSRNDIYPEAKDCTPANITISCVDNVKSRLAIAEFLRYNTNGNSDQLKPYYWLDFGNQTDRGQVVLGTICKIKQPNEKDNNIESLQCIDEIYNLAEINEEDSGPSCSLAEALQKQDLFINPTLCQIGCALLWKMFTDGSINTQGAYINLSTLSVNPIKL